MAEVQQDEEKEKNPEVISFIMAKKMKWQNIPICKMYQIFCHFANISSDVSKHKRYIAGGYPNGKKNHICIWQFFHICKSDFAISSFAILKEITSGGG